MLSLYNSCVPSGLIRLCRVPLAGARSKRILCLLCVECRCRISRSRLRCPSNGASALELSVRCLFNVPMAGRLGVVLRYLYNISTVRHRGHARLSRLSTGPQL